MWLNFLSSFGSCCGWIASLSKALLRDSTAESLHLLFLHHSRLAALTSSPRSCLILRLYSRSFFLISSIFSLLYFFDFNLLRSLSFSGSRTLLLFVSDCKCKARSNFSLSYHLSKTRPLRRSYCQKIRPSSRTSPRLCLIEDE